MTIRRKVGRRGWRSQKGAEYGAWEYVSAYNLVSHSRAQALGQVAIDGTDSHGKWPVPSPGPPDSLVEDRPLCRDRTSASQTLTVADRPAAPSFIIRLLIRARHPLVQRREAPTSERTHTCRANINARQERMKSRERIIRRRKIILNLRQDRSETLGCLLMTCSTILV